MFFVVVVFAKLVNGFQPLTTFSQNTSSQMFKWFLNMSLHVFHIYIFVFSILYPNSIYKSQFLAFVPVSLISVFVSKQLHMCRITQQNDDSKRQGYVKVSDLSMLQYTKFQCRVQIFLTFSFNIFCLLLSLVQTPMEKQQTIALNSKC